MKPEIVDCPFCAMPCNPETVFDIHTQSLAVECPNCYACGPRATSEEEAQRLFRQRHHDVDWAYRKACNIAGKFAAAIGQTDREKIQALTIEIARKIGVRPRKNAETQEKT
jgi:hypothetical protein